MTISTFCGCSKFVSKLFSSSLVSLFCSIFVTIQLLLWLPGTSATTLNGKCGFPGKPYMSKVDLDLKLHYYEGEEVQYQCMDYWNYIQVRQCRKGHWSGPPARCADFLKYVWLRDVQIEDITNPLQPHNIINVRNITLDTGSWKFPNAFTNTRSAKKFILDDNRLYRWRLRFNDTFHKLFVRFNFNTINYTRLTLEQKSTYYLNVSLDVGPDRQCVLEMQTFDIWKVNGQKIDNFFVCDTRSIDSTGFHLDSALDKDVGPNDRMTLYTKSSLNISYELIAVFLGKTYGSEQEPICGEPEYDISHFSRFNQQFRDYSFECKKGDWVYQPFEDNSTKLANTGIHFKRCVTDMKWFGSYPTCLPKKQCSIDKLLTGSGTVPDRSMMIVSLDGLYFVNDTLYYAIDGTVATYSCANATTHILTGRETRTCFRNGTWSGIKPTCHDPNKAKISLLLIVIVTSSLLVLFIIVMLFIVITKRFKQKILKSIENQQQQTIAVKELMDLYSYNTDRPSSEIYENYHEIDDRYSKSAAEEVNQYVAIDYSGSNIIPHRRTLNGIEYVHPASISLNYGIKQLEGNIHSEIEDKLIQKPYAVGTTVEDQEELPYLTMQAERTNNNNAVVVPTAASIFPNPAPRLAGIRAKSGIVTTKTSNQDNSDAIYINYSS